MFSKFYRATIVSESPLSFDAQSGIRKKKVICEEIFTAVSGIYKCLFYKLLTWEYYWKIYNILKLE